MRSILRRFLKFIATSVILLLICIVIPAAMILMQRSSGEEEVSQQLAALDQQFDVDRSQLPLSINAELFLPEQVGDFQREPDIFLYEDCRKDDSAAFSCLMIPYYTHSSNPSLSVWIKISEKAQQTNLSSIVADECGRGLESGGLSSLRLLSKIPYIYHHTCEGIFHVSILTGITWQNSNSFIRVDGQYDAISEFIAAYPY